MASKKESKSSGATKKRKAAKDNNAVPPKQPKKETNDDDDGYCPDCGEELDGIFHACVLSDDDEPEKQEKKIPNTEACSVCAAMLVNGHCREPHNMCGPCFLPKAICRCVLLTPAESEILDQFHTDVRLRNYEEIGVKRGPHWDKLVAHATLVLSIAKAGCLEQETVRHKHLLQHK